MLEALKTAPGDAVAFRKMVRWNLGAWLGQVHQPLRIIELGQKGGHPVFSPDGASFASSYRNDPGLNTIPVSLWDTATGRRLATFPGYFWPFDLSPDGKRLVATSASWDGTLAVDLATGRPLWSIPSGFKYCGQVTFGLDGSVVLEHRSDDLDGRPGS